MTNIKKTIPDILIFLFMIGLLSLSGDYRYLFLGWNQMLLYLLNNHGYLLRFESDFDAKQNPYPLSI